jgi:hypothetical protein
MRRFSLRRFSFAIAALALIAFGMIDISPAQAVVCSEEICISRCFIGGGRRCLKACDRRIARRVASGICRWYGTDWWLGRQAPLGVR